MGLVYARDNGPGVSDAELERTPRYRDLLYARTGVGYRRSHRNRLRACAYSVGKTGGVGVLVHPLESLVAPGDPSIIWPRVTRYDHYKYGTNQDSSVSPKPGTNCLIYYNCDHNDQFTGINQIIIIGETC